MIDRHRTSTLPTLGLIALVAALVPAGLARAGVVQGTPAILDADASRLFHIKRKWIASPPNLTTTHTNQPPAPPIDPLENPEGRLIDLVPGIDTGPDEPLRGGLAAPADPGGIAWTPEFGRPTLGPVGIALGPLDLTSEDFGSALPLLDTMVAPVGPSIVPGPGALGLLIAAGLGRTRRRRHGNS